MHVNISHLDHALRLVFTPLCRLLIRCGVPVRHVIGLLKQSYVDAAEAEIRERGGRLSTSEISRMTGITRQEVSRHRNGPAREPLDQTDYPVWDTTVLSTWSKNTRYLDAEGEPLPLPMTAEGPSFSELVEMSYPGADAAALAGRLLANGNILQGEDGVFVFARKNVSVNRNLPQLILDVLAAPATTLIANTHPDPARSFCQRVAFIARPSDRRIGPCRLQMRHRIVNFVEEVDQHLVALTAADSMTETAGDGRGKIGVGAFYFEMDD